MNIGAFGENFPYSNFHDLNLDWIINIIKDFKEHFDEYKDEVDSKINKPVDDPYGVNGYLLKTNGDGTTEWINYYPIIEPAIKEEVSDWLDEHPEATTTVEDDSITSIKFSKNYIPFYCVTDYDILPNSGDIYTKLHTLLKEKVSQTGGIVYFPKGKYTISYTIFIPENTVFVGDGFDSEIYFDEYDTTAGVGLSNAGSNIVISNLKVSQYDTGTFHDGAQAGCIGFSNWQKGMSQLEPYEHTWLYNTSTPVRNIIIDTVYCNGKYALQTETTSNGTIENVVYRNITAPLSCVSVKVTTESTISNFIAENITCNLFRIRGSANALTSGTAKNFIVRNVKSASFIFRTETANNPTAIYCENLQTTGEELNHDIVANEIWIASNIIFQNCLFNLKTSIYQYQNNFIRKYFSCVISNTTNNERIFNNAGTTSNTDTDQSIFEYCTLTQTGNGGQVLGYGKHNKCSNTFINRIYGDCHYEHRLDYLSPSGRFGNYLIHDYGTNHLHYYAPIENTNNIFTVPENMELLYNCPNAIPVTIWNSSTPNQRITTFARVVSGVLRVYDPIYDNSTDYDRVFICTPITIPKLPSMMGIYNSL